jgi:hypothetical protein
MYLKLEKVAAHFDSACCIGIGQAHRSMRVLHSSMILIVEGIGLWPVQLFQPLSHFMPAGFTSIAIFTV